MTLWDGEPHGGYHVYEQDERLTSVAQGAGVARRRWRARLIGGGGLVAIAVLAVLGLGLADALRRAHQTPPSGRAGPGVGWGVAGGGVQTSGGSRPEAPATQLSRGMAGGDVQTSGGPRPKARAAETPRARVASTVLSGAAASRRRAYDPPAAGRGHPALASLGASVQAPGDGGSERAPADGEFGFER